MGFDLENLPLLGSTHDVTGYEGIVNDTIKMIFSSEHHTLDVICRRERFSGVAPLSSVTLPPRIYIVHAQRA